MAARKVQESETKTDLRPVVAGLPVAADIDEVDYAMDKGWASANPIPGENVNRAVKRIDEKTAAAKKRQFVPIAQSDVGTPQPPTSTSRPQTDSRPVATDSRPVSNTRTMASYMLTDPNNGMDDPSLLILVDRGDSQPMAKFPPVATLEARQAVIAQAADVYERHSATDHSEDANSEHWYSAGPHRVIFFVLWHT